MRVKLILLAMFFWLCLVHSGQGQEVIDLDISVAGIKIGEMKATQHKIEDKEILEINSQVKFWFFTWVEVMFDSEAIYQDGFLLNAISKTTSNKGDFSSNVGWNGEYYHVNVTSYKFENQESLPDLIAYSTSKLYFEEPKNNQVFMAETFGLLSVIAEKKDYYEILVNGNKNRFYYQNGQFIKAVMQSPIKNYVVSRRSK